MKQTKILNLTRTALFSVTWLCASMLMAQDLVVSLEAEDAELTAPVKVKYVDGFSGDAYVGDNNPGSVILFTNIEIEEEGTYEFKTYYTSMQHRSIAIKANSYTETICTIVNTTPGWDAPPTETMSAYIYLDKGMNTIQITPEGDGGPNIDKFEILTTDYELPKPGEFPYILEAESAHLFGSLVVKPLDGSLLPGLSGGRYIGDFNQSKNSYLQFMDIEIPEEGAYELKVFSMGSGRRLTIKVNEYEKTIITTGTSANWDAAPTVMVSTLIYMDEGMNRITMGTYNDDGPNLDKIEIHQTDETIPRPAIETRAFISDHTDESEIIAEHENETLSYLTDNDEFTIYTIPGVTFTQIVAKCKQPVLLTGYLLSAGLDSEEDVTTWTLESSTDGTNWTVLTPDDSSDLIGAHLFTINRNHGDAPEEAAQYYRLTATGKTDVEIAEWQLFGAPYFLSTVGENFPADITEGLDLVANATAYPAGASGDDWSEEFYNLFNRDLSKKYYASETTAFTVEVELDKAYKLHSYTLTSVEDFPERDPKRWTFSGYAEDLGWVELDRHTEFLFPSRYATMRFDINSEIGFTKFLLDVEKNNGAEDSQLLKWQLFGEEYKGNSMNDYTTDTYSVWSEQGMINMIGNTETISDYKIYNITGVLVAKGTLSANSQQSVTLSQGIYVVDINNYATKVIVQ